MDDALSRRQEGLQADEISEVGLLMAVSMITPMWIQEIMHSYSEDSFVQELMTLLSVDTHGPSLWHNVNGVLRRKGKVYVGSQGPLRQQLISNFHDTPLGGHSGSEVL